MIPKIIFDLSEVLILGLVGIEKQLGKTKKNPHTFLDVLEQMTYSASECLFIDDSAKNIEVAASVGISGIQFANAQQLHKELVDRQIL